MRNPRASESLREAVRLERGGLLEKALVELGVAALSDDPAVLAQALRHQADIHRARCQWDEALGLARRSAEAARAAGLSELEAEAINAEAAVHLTRRAFDIAEPLFERMLAITGDPRVQGIALQNLGISAAEQGHLEEARRRFMESHDRFDAAGYLRGQATTLVNSGRIALLEGDDESAEQLCSRADALARRVGDLELSALASLNLAEALLRRGRFEEAEPPASVALGYFTGVGNDWRRIECLCLFGDITRAGGDAETAGQCYRRALQLARDSDTTREVERIEARIRDLEASTAIAAD